MSYHQTGSTYQSHSIILLTSLSNPEDVFLGLEAGADCYMSKPYESKALLSRVESALDSLQRPSNEKPEEELEVFLGSKRYLIKSSRRQIMNLLLSTYQDAVEQNRILREMRTKLVMVNEELQKLVAERTEALNQEIEERKRIEGPWLLKRNVSWPPCVRSMTVSSQPIPRAKLFE